MNLKKTILSVIGAASLLLTGLTPMVSAADYTSTTGGAVSVNAAGTFNPYLCGGTVDFGSVNLSSATVLTGRDATGMVIICYTDTVASRGTFRTALSASDFNRDGGGASISATNLSPANVYNPAQGQWSGAVCGAPSPTTRPCIGDIGGYNGSGNVTSNAASTTWTGGNLATAQTVGFGYAGAGTADPTESDPRLAAGSYAEIGLKLNVPQNTPTGYYVSTLTIDVYMDEMP